MTKNRFIEARRPAWDRFDELLKKSGRIRGGRLDGEEISEMSRLFRGICYDLSTVRSREWGRDLEDLLNALVARGYHRFYREPPGRPRAVVQFFTAHFPRLLRANQRYFWASLVLFVLPGLVAGGFVSRDPDVAGKILSPEQLAMYELMYSDEMSEVPARSEATMTGFYVYNNIGIAFRCFATGIFFGIGTIYFLIFNSLAIGTTAAYLVAKGYSERFFSFVISHGSFELTAIVIAGAAGLIVGHALVHPGPYRRLDALRVRGADAIRLAAGAGAMLAVAAVIEGFWSPSAAPNQIKYFVGSLLWICVVLYLVRAGRRLDPKVARK